MKWSWNIMSAKKLFLTGEEIDEMGYEAAMKAIDEMESKLTTEELINWHLRLYLDETEEYEFFDYDPMGEAFFRDIYGMSRDEFFDDDDTA